MNENSSPQPILSAGNTLQTFPAEQRLAGAAEALATGTIAYAVAGVPIVRATQLLEATATGLRFSASIEDLAQLHGRVVAGTSITIALRHGNDDLVFSVELQKFEIGAGRELAVLTSAPDQVAVSQRRRGFRLLINKEDAVTLRVWRLAKHALVRDRPLPSSEVVCELFDLGSSGMRVLIRPRGATLLNLNENDRFRVELGTAKQQILIEGRLRHPRTTGRDDTEAVCGVRFVDRDDIESRRAFQTLQIMLAELQRTSARRRAAA